MKNRNKLVIAIWIVIGLTLAFVNNARAMEFEVNTYPESGEQYVDAWGEIVVSDAEDFEAFLAKNNLPAGTDIWLYSGGGNVWAAQEMAKDDPCWWF